MPNGIRRGLIGLGGAEFRLPVLIAVFAFAPLEAVILNKASSLVVVASALPFRAATVPWTAVGAAWPILANLVVGSVLGAWAGAGLATQIRQDALRRVLSVLLVGIAGVLMFAHEPSAAEPLLAGAAQIVVGGIVGFVIGVIASLMGVAGGELLIPTIVLLYGADLKLAGSLSLAVSLPTMLTGFARYSRDQSFSVLARNRVFVAAMAAGSITGAFIGSRLLGVVPNQLLLPALAAILLISAVKLLRHRPVVPR